MNRTTRHAMIAFTALLLTGLPCLAAKTPDATASSPPARAIDFQAPSTQMGTIQPVVRYYQADRLERELALELRDKARVSDGGQAEWTLDLESRPVEDRRDAVDYRFTFTLAKGEAKAAAVGVSFAFSDWSSSNFVLVPGAVYDGNRFAVKAIEYPPYWYDKREWKLDMPTTITDCPRLAKDGATGRIDLDTGNATVPMMAFHAPAAQRGWMVLTTQGSRLGNHGLLIEEDPHSGARLTITAPAVRQSRPVMGSMVCPSGDHAAAWKAGDTVTIQCRVFAFQARQRADLMQRFFEVRKDLNPADRKESLPYSAARQLLDELYAKHRWDEGIGMYRLTDPAEGTSAWNSIWQLGWNGGGQITLPLLMQGDAETRRRALLNLDVIFTKTQAASGFFNTIGNGKEFVSFGFWKNFVNHESLIRSQGDWLYMAQRQFQWIESTDGSVPASWKEGLRRQADAFVRLWDKRGQFGQFVDVETGDICVGGSTSGAIAVGGLALASRSFHAPRDLEVAQAAGRKYYRDFVQAGYTTGGPGEILSAPDSESAFGLLESYMALYEVTGDSEWLGYAKELLPICASWTVAYDYRFPAGSPMGRIDARSCGAVWANLPNKHAAPGIATWSGDCLLKYYRASGDLLALELLRDIAHGITQYISRPAHELGRMPPGAICERVNLSDWEGQDQVGGSIFGSCPWVEAAALLTVVQIPGLYVQPDTGVFAAFDNIRAETISHAEGVIRLKLTNPTKFPADVTVLTESARDARRAVSFLISKHMRVVHLDADVAAEVEFR
ncbi:MAG: hypothetical protein NTW21_07325 [Verrucomicrobia bacterium]|nr:hypothetical protein [Verrucomicrobiota bacterium]